MKEIKDNQIILALLALAVLILIAGYFIYINLFINKAPTDNNGMTQIQTPKDIIPVTPPVSLNNPNDKQVSGTILSSDKSTITLKLDNGTTQTFKLSPNILIAPIPTPGQPLILGRDPTKIKAGSKATLSLESQNNSDIVVNLNYTK